MSPTSPTIGLIAGSGPDAGIDLWHKVLVATRHRLGAAYTGDRDAPRVEVVSEPALGASMDLPATDAEVWSALESTARAIAERCDVYAIACNTLNVYVPRLQALGLPAELVGFDEAVVAWAREEGIAELGLLAARPVAALGEWSPFTALAEEFALETPADLDEIHELITAIKSDGGADPGHRHRLSEVAKRFEATTVLLACTELPLVAGPIPGRRFVDVTEIVAHELVRRWWAIAPG